MTELSELNPSSPLLSGITQYDVDFVIARAGIDVPLGIDPFLMFKSRDPDLAALHASMLQAFNIAIIALRSGDIATAEYLFDFPEVSEVGLGYTVKSKKGSGLGDYLSRLIIETLKDSPALMERGVRHIEEMQLVSVGIAADRTSDITANLIKEYLISYTQSQSQLWDLPLMKEVPLNHIFDLQKFTWYDNYVDLPISPVDGSPILLVPRRVVRALPWINYDDYFKMEFSAYLRAKRVRKTIGPKLQVDNAALLSKSSITAITRMEVERIDRYVNEKERTAEQAQPSTAYLDNNAVCAEAERLRSKLEEITPGRSDASAYQRVVLEILNYLFNPELINGSVEVKTYDGTERRDIIFTNDSDQTFWSYVRTRHSSFLLMFETKNVSELRPENFNQVATYLGDRIGQLGFIITRNAPTPENDRKAFAIYNDSTPRKIILVLTDQDLTQMMRMRCSRGDPMRHMQERYRWFLQTVQ